MGLLLEGYLHLRFGEFIFGRAWWGLNIGILRYTVELLTYLIFGTGSPEDLHNNTTLSPILTVMGEGPSSTTAGTARQQ